MRLRSYESVIAFRFVFSRKIRGPATFDFCNTIEEQRKTFAHFDVIRFSKPDVLGCAEKFDETRPAALPRSARPIRRMFQNLRTGEATVDRRKLVI
jgi:hypothetical protein